MRGRSVCFLVMALILAAQAGYGAGFGIYEGSARGNALGGTTVARDADPSAIYFNPAGITQLEGLQMEAGATFIMPSTEVKTTSPFGIQTTEAEDNVYIPPHVYGTYQMNDSVWLGVGIYSRFGLGTEFDEDWPGRYNSYKAIIQSLNFNPDIALKVGDQLSVAAGVSAVWFDMDLAQKLPDPAGAGPDMDLELTGDSIGYGFNLGLRYQATEQMALGVGYQSEVDQDVEGEADLQIAKTDASGDVTLPQMVFAGVAFAPTEKLSVEVGTTFTGWSSYDELKIDFENPMLLGPSATIPKDWDDVWRYQAGVEYMLNDQWVLRAGYVYDEEPIPNDTVDYLVPGNDRQLYSIGCGYTWNDWALNLSYTYLDIQDRHVHARPGDGVWDSEFKNGDAQMLGVSLTAKL